MQTLIDAIHAGDVAAVQQWVTDDPTLTQRAVDRQGNTALHIAAQAFSHAMLCGGNPTKWNSVIAVLLQHGADPWQRNAEHETAMQSQPLYSPHALRAAIQATTEAVCHGDFFLPDGSPRIETTRAGSYAHDVAAQDARDERADCRRAQRAMARYHANKRRPLAQAGTGCSLVSA